MSGVRLEAKVHLVTCAVNAAQNIENVSAAAVSRSRKSSSNSWPSSYSVLTDDERELGVCLVDIGGGTTDIAIFTDGSYPAHRVIPIAGDQVTNDIAMALRTRPSMPKKSKFATPVRSRNWPAPMKPIKVPSVGDRAPGTCRARPWRKWWSRATTSFSHWCRPNCGAVVMKTWCRRASCSAAAPRKWKVVELAEEIFHMPVRVGYPQNRAGFERYRAQSRSTPPAWACCCTAQSIIRRRGPVFPANPAVRVRTVQPGENLVAENF